MGNGENVVKELLTRGLERFCADIISHSCSMQVVEIFLEQTELHSNVMFTLKVLALIIVVGRVHFCTALVDNSPVSCERSHDEWSALRSLTMT